MTRRIYTNREQKRELTLERADAEAEKRETGETAGKILHAIDQRLDALEKRTESLQKHYNGLDQLIGRIITICSTIEALEKQDNGTCRSRLATLEKRHGVFEEWLVLQAEYNSSFSAKVTALEKEIETMKGKVIDNAPTRPFGSAHVASAGTGHAQPDIKPSGFCTCIIGGINWHPCPVHGVPQPQVKPWQSVETLVSSAAPQVNLANWIDSRCSLSAESTQKLLAHDRDTEKGFRTLAEAWRKIAASDNHISYWDRARSILDSVGLGLNNWPWK